MLRVGFEKLLSKRGEILAITDLVPSHPFGNVRIILSTNLLRCNRKALIHGCTLKCLFTYYLCKRLTPVLFFSPVLQPVIVKRLAASAI